ncbi:hypothetical protein PVAP13_4KG149010 [Panicum virgatum]|uniref:Uncharacterized protein n=1 Tax=Panicum virgatum TaxID=38727 RepID=A0A8T0TTQ2_PANVG|nr:hypothetical protein PVAP13_4KG149010 [Panicum virgatum]
MCMCSTIFCNAPWPCCPSPRRPRSRRAHPAARHGHSTTVASTTSSAPFLSGSHSCPASSRSTSGTTPSPAASPPNWRPICRLASSTGTTAISAAPSCRGSARPRWRTLSTRSPGQAAAVQRRHHAEKGSHGRAPSTKAAMGAHLQPRRSRPWSPPPWPPPPWPSSRPQRSACLRSRGAGAAGRRTQGLAIAVHGRWRRYSKERGSTGTAAA